MRNWGEDKMRKIINNKLYFEPENANIKFIGGGKFEGNEIYNSFNERRS